jgi:hypothetical protein
MYASIQTPADGAVASSYGEIGRIPDAMFKTFMSRFQGPNAPNPHDVAEAIAKLVAQGKGGREPRTIVGAAYGADRANADVAPVQSGVVGALGLGRLEKIA